MKFEWTLHPINRHDLDCVMEIERSAYPVPWSYGVFYDCLLAKYECQGLWQGRDMLGYFVAQGILDEMHLLNICVSPAAQRRGIGRFLMKSVISLCERQKKHRLFLEVRVSNSPAQQLYSSMGFKEIGRRRNYYPALSGREDGIAMALDICEMSARIAV